MCEVIDAKRQCTKSIAKEIIIEEKEGKSEASTKRRKMIYDTRNMLNNAEVGFLIGMASYRELLKVEMQRLKDTCNELDMPFDDALEMIENIRKTKRFEAEKENKTIVLPVTNLGEA